MTKFETEFTFQERLMPVDKIIERTDERSTIQIDEFKENEENEEKDYKEIEETQEAVVMEKCKEYFDGIKFSSDASNFEETCDELEEDLEEFIKCMQNSVFYGSGIQRFYNQELDKFRRRFIEKEEEQRRWYNLVLKINKPLNYLLIS